MGNPPVPILLCLEVAGAFFIAAVWLIWVVHPPARPPARLAHMSREQRKQRIRSTGWLCLMGGVLSLGGAFLMYTLGAP